jgi:hypothetical protein
VPGRHRWVRLALTTTVVSAPSSCLIGTALVRAMVELSCVGSLVQCCAYIVMPALFTAWYALFGMVIRNLSEPEKKRVAARQQWRCSACEELLSSAYQVDHTIPLCDGGRDHICNATAMCANCHALKTQSEAAARACAARAAQAAVNHGARAAAYDDRVDWYITQELVRCDACRRTRPAGTPHTMCVALEDPNGSRAAVLLARFAYTRRV